MQCSAKCPYSPDCKGAQAPIGKRFQQGENNLRPVVSTRLVVLAIVAAIALARRDRRRLSGTSSCIRSAAGTSGVQAPTSAQAGGSVVAAYPQIDVVIAEHPTTRASRRSSTGTATLKASPRRERVAIGVRLGWDGDGGGCRARPVADDDTFSPLQWWSQRIQAPNAHTITGGSRKVLVGVIDTGVDANHPDLDDNVDWSRSVSCVGGSRIRDPAAWNDDSGHGTNVAGVIAAEANGIGIVGIAPNVKLAIVKASTHSGDSDVFLARRGRLLARVGRRARRRRRQQQLLGRTAPLWAGRQRSAGRPGAARDHQGGRARGRVRAATRRLRGRVGREQRPRHHRPGARRAAAGCRAACPAWSPSPRSASSIGSPSDRPRTRARVCRRDRAGGGDFLQGIAARGLVLGPWPASMQVPNLLCDPCTGPDAATTATSRARPRRPRR